MQVLSRAPKRLRNVEMRSHCPQTFLSTNFEVGMTFQKQNILFRLRRAVWVYMQDELFISFASFCMHLKQSACMPVPSSV